MEREELIRLVTAEVERRLAAAPRFLALVEPGPDLKGALSDLLRLPAGLAAVLVSRAARAPEAAGVPALLATLPDDPDLLETQVLPGIDCLVLPNLRAGSAARIALGFDHSTVPRLAHAALWAGKRLVVTPGWPATGGPPAFRRTFEGYLDRLREYGAVVVDRGGDLEGAVTGEPPAGDALLRTEATYDRRLLAEADVLALVRQGLKALTLPPGTLVTALAADAARLHGLHLRRR